MTTNLFLPNPFFSEARATIENEAHHHLFKVKRHQVGDRLRIVDGQGAARWAEIVGIDKRSARLALGEAAEANEPAFALELFVAAPKPERASWLVEKVTELGVVAVHFVATDRDARSFAPAQLARLRRIAISAVEQCGRSVVPELAAGGELEGAVARARQSRLPMTVLDAAGTDRLAAGAGGGRGALLVGPEGGWSPEERALFARQELPMAALGSTVLRVETAAVVAAGLLLCSGVSR
jgi:16S rRNA (uracil1498-N3)-methyltransferase